VNAPSAQSAPVPDLPATESDAPGKPAARSIAVLPFVDLSEARDQEYFADGMAEEIINVLARAPELQVAARTSSFFFKGKPAKIPDIARELHVTHVLAGSVRKSGNRLRLTAQLTRAKDGYNLWSRTYDRELQDVFELQDEVANAVTQALRIGLKGGPLTRPKGGTENLEAYDLYLRGATDFRTDRESLERIDQYLDQATRLDPEFGLAWTALGANAFVMAERGLIDANEGYERARMFLLKAIGLSPNLAQAHAYLATVYFDHDWNWPAAEAELKQALALDPRNPQALHSSGMLATTRGQWQRAEEALRAALVLDPLNPFVISNLGEALYRSGRFAEAEATFRKIPHVDAGFVWTPFYLARALLAQGKRAEALAIVQQDPDEEDRMALLSIVLNAAGKTAESQAALETLIEKYSHIDAYYVAMTYAHRGENDQAFSWLERALRQKDVSLTDIIGEPLFDKIVSDRRYKPFLRKMNLDL
jgi:TolB-like protein/Flp pilus assembly protein TadD